MINNKENSPKEFTARQFAERLDVPLSWLKLNRRGNNPLPYVVAGYRTILYVTQEILQWFGRKDLQLRFHSTKHLAQRLGFSIAWVKANRKSADPIPFIRIGWLIRYDEADIVKWLKNHMVKVKRLDEQPR